MGRLSLECLKLPCQVLTIIDGEVVAKARNALGTQSMRIWPCLKCSFYRNGGEATRDFPSHCQSFAGASMLGLRTATLGAT